MTKPTHPPRYLQLLLETEPHADAESCAELAREVRDLLRRELAVPVTFQAANSAAEQQRDHPRYRDPVAVAALIIAIPGSALAIHDLATRLKLKDSLHRAVMWARERRARAVWCTSVDHIALPGDEERTLDEILDELGARPEAT